MVIFSLLDIFRGRSVTQLWAIQLVVWYESYYLQIDALLCTQLNPFVSHNKCAMWYNHIWSDFDWPIPFRLFKSFLILIPWAIWPIRSKCYKRSQYWYSNSYLRGDLDSQNSSRDQTSWNSSLQYLPCWFCNRQSALTWRLVSATKLKPWWMQQWSKQLPGLKKV